MWKILVWEVLNFEYVCLFIILRVHSWLDTSVFAGKITTILVKRREKVEEWISTFSRVRQGDRGIGSGWLFGYLKFASNLSQLLSSYKFTYNRYNDIWVPSVLVVLSFCKFVKTDFFFFFL